VLGILPARTMVVEQPVIDHDAWNPRTWGRSAPRRSLP
jgi:hypothetical protein